MYRRLMSCLNGDMSVSLHRHISPKFTATTYFNAACEFSRNLGYYLEKNSAGIELNGRTSLSIIAYYWMLAVGNYVGTSERS